MNISELCIRRPVLTTLMTASIIVFGVFAYRLLAVAALPAVDFPTIQITATFPGASPETMAASVASPIERQLSTIAGMDRIVYLEAGRIVEEGPHRDLLAKGGAYARLWNRQMGGFINAA